MLKKQIKKLMPRFLLDFYYETLAWLAAFFYASPSEQLIVIGVTGTNGKSTTVNLIAKALEANGDKVGLTSTVNFKIAEKEWLNNKKMTMLGRFQLQKLLSKMVAAGCKYAIIETSSEGIKQFRHSGINYDYVVFTNLTPEHIESHGSFENYKKAKGELFVHLTAKKRKKLFGKEIPKISVINVDDEHNPYYLAFPADKKIRYSIENCGNDVLCAENVNVSLKGTGFSVQNFDFNLQLIGAFNVYNSLPAIAIAMNEGIPLEKIKTSLEEVPVVPGRMELIDEGQPFSVLVDYAPEPFSLAKCYETIEMIANKQDKQNKQDPEPCRFWASKQDESEEKNSAPSHPSLPYSPSSSSSSSLPLNRIIHVLGSCGGGRDKARRPILGKMAGQFADIVIVTNEDPYDDNPLEIIDQVAAGAQATGKTLDFDLFKILDRVEAINKAMTLAEPGDLVLLTGKGSEQAIAVENGNYLPWDEREVAREALKQLDSQRDKSKV